MQFELGMTRNGLIDTKNLMAQAVSNYSSPREFLRQHSDMVDGLVRKAFQKAQSQVSALSVCLIAVGGYGRAELAPYSDVDLLLLYSSSKKEDLPPLIEKILYPLWDLGLEVSCSSRSIGESLKMAQSDLHIKTGLIDGRYLDGEYEFFRRLYSLFTKRVLHRNVQKFAEALANDLHLRNQKYEDPAYVLEPNIKEGEGGLRDFQIGRWIIRAKYQTDRWDSILFPDHSRMLERSLQFLWAVRNQLHLLSGRRQDHLTFELQEKIAPILGLSPGTEGIEEMMRQYHLSTQRISTFVYDILDRTLHEPSWAKKTFFFFQRRKIDENFGMAYGELHLFDPVTFKRDPSQLMTLFKHCQGYQTHMDFRTEEAVMEALPFVDDRFRTMKGVNQTFLSILRKGDGVDAILKKMHELGLLSRYIPEFSEIEGKVHYDLYHVHPVDIHSILAVEELGKLRGGLYQKDYPLLTSLVREIENPEILFLTTLLHDVGKGMDGDHSLIGKEMVKHIGERMGLLAENRELMEFLVSHHLYMIETGFRRDLHDEQVILRFANEVKNIRQLRMLYLLTFADIKAVGPEAWTSWKNTLLIELFLKVSHFFEKGAVAGPFLESDEMIQKLQASLSREIISEYAEHLPDRYLSCYSSDEIVHHLELAHSVEKKLLLVDWEIENEIQARVTVCTKDRYGLFSKITGSMFLNRLNILEAQIHTWGNGIVLDTFWVVDATRNTDRRLQEFKKDLEEILGEKVSLRDLFAKRKESNGIKQKVIPRVPQEVKVNNQDSDFYTIVEVMGEDRLGILYEITQALTDHGCDIHFARISTLGNRIVDVFYVQDEWGEKIKEKNRTDQLKRTILSRLTPREENLP
ncbi:MAG TPA: [protein-PII] uridylyltransferase [Thermodesulfobacteriota bacterium]|nr:[protein-PII] uridylyltransferase [Thermodesulfobacteriota bacterium]